MVFYKNIDDLSEKIIKISRDENLRKSIGKNGKKNILNILIQLNVADFIINKTFRN